MGCKSHCVKHLRENDSTIIAAAIMARATQNALY
jgi:hypothetical protein